MENIVSMSDIPSKNGVNKPSEPYREAQNLMAGLDPKIVTKVLDLVKTAESMQPPNNEGSGGGGAQNTIINWITTIILGLFLGGNFLSGLMNDEGNQRIIDKIEAMDANISGRIDLLEDKVIEMSVDQATTDAALMDYINATSEYDDRPDSVKAFMERTERKNFHKRNLVKNRKEKERENHDHDKENTFTVSD
jgi:hypothetical protein